jgi:hypothetical protein
MKLKNTHNTFLRFRGKNGYAKALQHYSIPTLLLLSSSQISWEYLKV